MAIDLSRRFVECAENNQSDPDLVAHFGGASGTLGWDDLLRRRRVVFLAEAGSGKTTELVARSSATSPDQGDAFYATVEDVGRHGLDGALLAADRERLKAWRASERDAWFFIESVDEAKDSEIKLQTVVRYLADGIAGGERRALQKLRSRRSSSVKRWFLTRQWKLEFGSVAAHAGPGYAKPCCGLQV